MATALGTALSMVRGDSGQLYTITVSGLSASGLTGCGLWFTAKHDAADADSAAVFQKSIGAGIAVTTVGNASTAGVALVTIAAADTASLPEGYASHLVWDVQMRDAAGQTTTLTTGTLDVAAEVTQA